MPRFARLKKARCDLTARARFFQCIMLRDVYDVN